jgi:tetratricopeptide (TPR) repeat protein
MKTFVLIALISVLSLSVFAQREIPAGFDLSNYGVRVEPDKRLMVVLAALESAQEASPSGGTVPALKTPLSAQGSKFREKLRADLAEMNPELRQKISLFVGQYKKRHPKASDADIVAPFISMAFALTPAPELADPIVTSDLPGDLLDVLDFAPLAREFYRRSGFSAKIEDYAKSYRETADGTLRSSTREMVSDVLDYLHTKPQIYYTERIKTQTQKSNSKKTTLNRVESVEHQRHFYIIPEMLTPAGTINFLNIRDDYYVVVPADTDIGSSEVRRGFLQFVFDPLVLNNPKDISTVSAGIKQLLDERRKVNPSVSPDVYLTISRSLVAAVDIRQNEFEKVRIATAQARQKIDMMPTEADKKAVSLELEKFKKIAADEAALQLSEDYEKGSVLSFYFAEQIRGLEDSGFDVASSMREMILSMLPEKEAGRLEQFAEARKRAETVREERRKNPGNSAPILENPVTVRLLEIQKTIDAKNYAKANTELKLLLEKNPGEARIHYNIGRVASLSAESITDIDLQKEKLLEAKVAYSNVLRSATPATDKALLSLTYVALARIYEFYDEDGYAIQLYDQAIKLTDVAGGAFKEALAGKQKLLKQQQPPQ